MPASRGARHARRGLVVAVAAASAVVAVTAPDAASTRGSSAGTASYAHAQRVCAAAQAQHASCFAMRLVRTRRVAPGSVRIDAMTPSYATAPSYPTGPGGGYTPRDLSRAYGVNSDARTRQTVAIVDAFRDPNIRHDLNTFDRHYHLGIEKAHSLRVVNQRGGSPTTVKKDTTGWTFEQALDVDAVRGMCHNCKILLVEADSNSDGNLAAAENYAARHAKIVSNSFGEAETNPSSVHHHRAFNHPGVAVLASTGDDGWYGWDVFNEGGHSDNAPSAPASLPAVVAVGGTTLYLNRDGSRAGEQVWNQNGSIDQFGVQEGFALGASGGGCSTRYAAPPWQAHGPGYGSLGCGTKRSTGDIAAVADPSTGYDIYTSYRFQPGVPTGWLTFGGTSLSSPLVAAMWGLAGGPRGVRYPALTLYGHYKSARATHDVRIGGNGLCGGAAPTSCRHTVGRNPNTLGAGRVDCAFRSSGHTIKTKYGQCDAQQGFDGPTGVGTPHGLRTFARMKPHAVIGPFRPIVHGRRQAFGGRHSSDPFPGGAISSYRWLWGDGTARSKGPTPRHTYRHAGTYTMHLVVTDNYGFTDTATRRVHVR